MDRGYLFGGVEKLKSILGVLHFLLRCITSAQLALANTACTSIAFGELSQLSEIGDIEFSLASQSSEQVVKLSLSSFFDVPLCDIACGAIIATPGVMVLTITERVEGTQGSVGSVKVWSSVATDGCVMWCGLAEKIKIQRTSPSSF